MFIKCDMFAVLQFPATHATTGAFGAISTAYFPIFGGFHAFKNNIGNG